MKYYLLPLCLLILGGIVTAQEASSPPLGDDTLSESTELVDTSTTSIKVLIMVNGTDPSKVLVYDEQGKWLAGIREVKIDLTIGEGITAKCTSWKGVMRPKSPKVKTYPVKEVRSVSATEFEEKLDELQSE